MGLLLKMLSDPPLKEDLNQLTTVQFKPLSNQWQTSLFF